MKNEKQDERTQLHNLIQTQIQDWNKKRESMAPTIEWIMPQLIAIPPDNILKEKDIKSNEAEEQKKRERDTLMKTYYRDEMIPPNPEEPQEIREVYYDIATVPVFPSQDTQQQQQQQQQNTTSTAPSQIQPNLTAGQLAAFVSNLQNSLGQANAQMKQLNTPNIPMGQQANNNNQALMDFVKQMNAYTQMQRQVFESSQFYRFLSSLL